jgi:hypothetical protein
MGQVTRMHRGPAKISAFMLTELDWLLDMDTAAPRGVVKPLADRLRDYHRDPDLDMNIQCSEEIHDYLRVLEVDAVQRLRSWHRLRHGTITVEARWLCEVRNLLDSLLYSWGIECEDYATGLDSAEAAIVDPAIEQDRRCNRCPWCQFLVMRDRIDVLLDAQGFDDVTPHYQAPSYDPDAFWRDYVMADAEQLLAA